ncbi:MAG: hypothetical protein IJV71_05035, partial [Lachnospiraceae bacterium]|nr:hypothetical protein [Lachnospiraceae bacterium]
MFEYMKASFKNLISNSKGATILLLIAQIFSVIIIVLSYGVVNHYNTKVDVKESVSLIHAFSVVRDEKTGKVNEFLDVRGMKNFYNKILPMIENKLDYFFVLGWCGEYTLQSSTGYENGVYTKSTQLNKRIGIAKGRSFTDEEIANGEYCIIVPQDMDNESGYWTFGGNEYKIIGTLSNESMTTEFFVPYGAIPEDTEVREISLIMEKPLLETEYEIISDVLRECFGDKVNIPGFSGIINSSNSRVYRDIMVVSIVLIFVFAINYCIIYRYILEKRRRIFAVSRICGGSKFKISVAYMFELLGMSLITLMIGVFLFDTAILPKATDAFEYINIYCNIEVYK